MTAAASFPPETRRQPCEVYGGEQGAAAFSGAEVLPASAPVVQRASYITDGEVDLLGAPSGTVVILADGVGRPLMPTSADSINPSKSPGEGSPMLAVVTTSVDMVSPAKQMLVGCCAGTWTMRSRLPSWRYRWIRPAPQIATHR